MIFKHVRRLIKLIKADGTGPRGEYFTFKFGDGAEIPITIEKNEFIVEEETAKSKPVRRTGTRINCKCKHCSVHNNKYLCRYKIALILYKSGVKG